MTIDQKIGQLFFVGISGPQIDEQTSDLLTAVKPGGVCLFARNIKDRSQTRSLLDSLRGRLDNPFLSVDQEGGLVDRLRRIMTPMPAADKIKTADDADRFGRIVGEALRILGFNMDFAPVVDVIDPSRDRFNNGLHSRAFGKSKNEAAELAGAFLDAIQHEGIIGCPKHFPGLGASEVDSHKELPTVSISETELKETDLHPYKNLVSAGSVKSVMIAHAAFPNVGLQERDQNGKLLPSSLSPAIISELLRGEFGFDGLVVTDDLEMGAIVENYGIGDACKRALAAGADMLAICAGEAAIREGYEAIAAAVQSGEITHERLDRSIERISTLKTKLAEPLPFDTERLDELSNEIVELNRRIN
ncbi:MAG TPA: glycoside hydrolase family 3 protein [Pyrinomonadaceae bacterium]|nr:glycoside hydrolase family 3 protein [Pyrinomonadaceae bacterium]